MNYNMLDEEAVLEGVKRFGPAPGARKMMDSEMLHATEAIESGTYITYWFEKKKSECGRLGSQSKCFCGHYLTGHSDKYFGKKLDTSCKECPCKTFKFVPTRPEECGMYWLPRRKDFNVNKWRPPCKCNHTCEEHNPNFPLKCTKCTNCQGFRAYFACISCDGAWEDHDVLYETEMERKQLGKAIRDNYKPLAKFQAIQHEVFENKSRSVDPALLRPRIRQGDVGKGPIMPSYRIMPAQMIIGPDGKSTFQAPKTKISFEPPPEDLNNFDDFPIAKKPQQQAQLKFNPVYDDIPVGSAQQKPQQSQLKFNPVYDDDDAYAPVQKKPQQLSMGLGSTKPKPISQVTKPASFTAQTKPAVNKPSTITGGSRLPASTGIKPQLKK